MDEDFKGLAVEKQVMYKDQIRFERLYSSEGVQGQSGSLLRDGEVTNDAVGRFLLVVPQT